MAEARAGHAAAGRALLRRCTAADPGCMAAWHAWAHLEEEQGCLAEARRLYQRALELKGGSLEILAALARLERLAGDEQAAARHLEAALERDPHHLASLQVRPAAGRPAGRPPSVGAGWVGQVCVWGGGLTDGALS